MKNYLIIVSVQCENDVDVIGKAKVVADAVHELVQVSQSGTMRNLFNVTPQGSVGIHRKKDSAQ